MLYLWRDRVSWSFIFEETHLTNTRHRRAECPLCRHCKGTGHSAEGCPEKLSMTCHRRGEAGVSVFEQIFPDKY